VWNMNVAAIISYVLIAVLEFFVVFASIGYFGQYLEWGLVPTAAMTTVMVQIWTLSLATFLKALSTE